MSSLAELRKAIAQVHRRTARASQPDLPVGSALWMSRWRRILALLDAPFDEGRRLTLSDLKAVYWFTGRPRPAWAVEWFLEAFQGYALKRIGTRMPMAFVTPPVLAALDDRPHLAAALAENAALSPDVARHVECWAMRHLGPGIDALLARQGDEGRDMRLQVAVTLIDLAGRGLDERQPSHLPSPRTPHELLPQTRQTLLAWADAKPRWRDGTREHERKETALEVLTLDRQTTSAELERLAHAAVGYSERAWETILRHPHCTPGLATRLLAQRPKLAFYVALEERFRRDPVLRRILVEHGGWEPRVWAWFADDAVADELAEAVLAGWMQVVSDGRAEEDRKFAAYQRSQVAQYPSLRHANARAAQLRREQREATCGDVILPVLRESRWRPFRRTLSAAALAPDLADADDTIRLAALSALADVRLDATPGLDPAPSLPVG